MHNDHYSVKLKIFRDRLQMNHEVLMWENYPGKCNQFGDRHERLSGDNIHEKGSFKNYVT